MKKLLKAIGKSYESEIFLHESCIYAQVAHKLRTMGYKVLQIYDGFFTDKELDKQEFDNIVKEQALSYYHKYINHNHKYNYNHNNNIFNINSGHIRDNSDIPDEDSLADMSKMRQEALQTLIDDQVISRRDASWLYLKLYDEEHTFKESRRGWCIEDRIAARDRRTYVMKTLTTKYTDKFTRKEVLNFIGE